MKKKLLYILLSFVLLAAGQVPARAQLFAVKTNAASWLACTPDIGFEVIAGEHVSVALSAFGHYKPYGVWDSKMIAVQPEFRYWFNGRPLTREYIGASAALVTYDTQMFRHTYRGNAVSLGVTGGYVFSLGKHWAFELSAGVGVLLFRHKQFITGDDYDEYFHQQVTEPNNWGYKLFPSKLNASFIYIIR